MTAENKPPRIDWLSGIRVLLIAHYIPGPLAAFLLKALGAEIIKIEPPQFDYMRKLPPFISGKKGRISAYFHAINQGFQSIVVDFKKKGGVDVLSDLIRKCDILIDGNRADFLTDILGGKISELNSEIVHLPITAFGLHGPLKKMAGHDNNILSMSGVLSYTPITDEKTASVFSVQIADITAGYLAALMAVASALGKKNAKSSFRADTVDVSMLHAAFFLNQIYLSALNATGRSPLPGKELLNGGLPNYRMYLTRDCKSVFFGPIEPNLFKNFCVRSGREDLIALDGKDAEKLTAELKKLIGSKALFEWEQLLSGCDCCFTAVSSLEEAAGNEQINHLGLVREVKDEEYGVLKLSGFPAGFTDQSLQPEMAESAPEPGQHTREILKNTLGYQDELVARLVEEKAVSVYVP
ncbi:MAG: CaiB/BaiF CoA-transferase family protein [Candidatus Wallbacteria bacterium]|nr:CaiB/BaiF CoA-transferase family protein [Candidatus Wallbacteria bacterium]